MVSKRAYKARKPLQLHSHPNATSQIDLSEEQCHIFMQMASPFLDVVFLGRGQSMHGLGGRVWLEEARSAASS